MNAFVSVPTIFRTHSQARTSVCRPRMTSSPTQPSTQTGVQYGGIQHAGVLVRDTSAAMKFYTEVLGMTDDTAVRNPKLPFDGGFVRAGTSQIHIMELPNPDPTEGRPAHGGRDRHLAVTVKDLNPLIESLEKHGREYTFSKSGRRAVFTRDIDANAIEFIEDADA